MISNILLLVSLLVATTAQAGNVNFLDCGKSMVSSFPFPFFNLISASIFPIGNKEVQTVSVENCSGDVCTLAKDKPTALDIKFTVNDDSSQVKIGLLAVWMGMNVTEPGYDQDGCNGHLKCPLVKSSQVDFNYDLVIRDGVPDNVTALMVATLTNEKSGLLACVKFNIQIQ